MKPEPRKPDLTGILTEDNSPILRNSVVPSMNMEEVEMLTAPGESPQKDFMELGEAGFAADQEAPPNQRAHIPKHHSELIKFCHFSSLPNLPRGTAPSDTRILPVSAINRMQLKFCGGRLLDVKRIRASVSTTEKPN
jgi:hypothetical protein